MSKMLRGNSINIFLFHYWFNRCEINALSSLVYTPFKIKVEVGEATGTNQRYFLEDSEEKKTLSGA